ncbi:ABC transporter ATP-binding protein [Falsigemmobacter intermedius]|uniref:ABC transporter ATP-binding protein n=1 Tax=Falsigemmobacter intermedius TaxID=1553448 RepID=A0A444M9P3_9RHOB|nr:ABC transporter ATP-binding protein [Falsigemmobacter intermedius]RWY39653.1 ABC transporter ATP-binding protein [Falsigemmobacter intermedius]
MTDLLVELRDLRKGFGEGEARTEVLKGVTLSLPQREFAALLGPSGSGKSTLLSIMGTLMKADSGEHLMLGKDLMAAQDAELTDFRNRRIGFVFQFHHLFPDLTALENVIFPAAVRAGRETSEQKARGRLLLERVGLAHRMNFRATALSGGQKQRVAIARALMNQPSLVLADEPTGNLDRENADQVMELLAEMNREEGTAFLISTHDAEIAAACHRRITLNDGRVA